LSTKYFYIFQKKNIILPYFFQERVKLSTDCPAKNKKRGQIKGKKRDHSMKKIKIRGLRFDSVTMEEAVRVFLFFS